MEEKRLAIGTEDSLASRNVRIIIILFGVFLLSFLWLGLFYKIESERQIALDDAFKDTANFARAFEEHTLRTIRSVDQAVLFLKHEYENAGSSIDIPQYIKEGRLASQPVVLLSVIDEHGNLAVSSQVPFVPSNLADREHFLVHKDRDSGDLFISKPVLGRSSGKWSIQMTRRVNKPDGSFGGVVVVSVDPYYFTQFYKQVNLGADSTIALIGRDGIVRARESGTRTEPGQDLRGGALMTRIEDREVGQYITTSDIDGIKRIHSYRALKEYPLVVSVGISENEAFRELNERVAGYYWVAALLTVVIIIFIIVLLFIAARQKQTQTALKQAYDTLEAEVEERTRELFVANQELEAMNEEFQHTNQELKSEIADRRRVETILRVSKEEMVERNNELVSALHMLEQAQRQLVQQEKLAGIGQLAAGVAHEINNPLGFVTSNVETLEEYFSAFGKVLGRYRQLCLALQQTETDAAQTSMVAAMVDYEKEQDLDYIMKDLPELFQDTLAGLERMSKIVRGMRTFSRVDQQAVFEQYDLLEGLESTLLVAHNEIKYNAAVEKHLLPIPVIEAVRGEINQVLLNLIVNAVHAIKDKHRTEAGIIRVATWGDAEFVYCAVEDNGTGIKPENLQNIFNPFFTTKPVGQGTGMGLSISYDIIVNRHKGDIWVESTDGAGAKFTFKLPIRHDGETAPPPAADYLAGIVQQGE